MFLFKKVIAIAVCGALLGGIIADPVHASAPASSGDTYHIDNSDANCNNEGPATVTEPWCDFDVVNQLSLQPGDSVLLARGARWNQELVLSAHGAPDEPVVVASYGEGPLPIIERDGSFDQIGVRIHNASHLSLGELEVAHAGAGVYFYYDTKHNEGIRVHDIFVHDVGGIHQSERLLPEGSPKRQYAEQSKIWNSAGIIFTGDISFTPDINDYALRNVVIERITGTANQNSLSFDWHNGISPQGGSSRPYYGENLVQDVLITDIHFYDDVPAEPRGCDDGLRIVNAMQVTLMNAVLEGEASCASATGTAAILLGRTQDVTIANTIITDTKDTGSADMVAIDYECCNSQITVTNSYFARNAGGALSPLAIYTDADMNDDLTIIDNTFLNNGPGALRRAGAGYVPTGSVKGNLFAEAAFTHVEGNADFRGFAFGVNSGVPSDDHLFYAAEDYGDAKGTAWSYWFSDSDEWAEMGLDEASNAWVAPEGGSISQFTMDPGAGSVARVWTAPFNGQLSVRGLAIWNQSDDGAVDIRRNGISLPRSADRSPLPGGLTGLSTSLDDISVKAGDTLEFVATGATRISWTPAIGYIDAATEWKFPGDSTTEWLSDSASNLSQEDGRLVVTLGDADSWIEAPAPLGIEAATHSIVDITLQNLSNAQRATVWFTTEADQDWSTSKSVSLDILRTATPQQYLVDMTRALGTTRDEAWYGTVTGMRVSFFDGSGGKVALHRYSVVNTPTLSPLTDPPTDQDHPHVLYHWDFESGLAGWSGAEGTVLTSNDGQIVGSSDAVRTGVISPENLVVDATQSRYLEIDFAGATAGTAGRVLFTTALDDVWDNAKYVPFTVPTDGTLRLDLARSTGWADRVTSIRIDVTAPIIHIDAVRLYSALPPAEHQPHFAADWTFEVDGDYEGWQVVQHMDAVVQGGALRATTTANDPYLTSPAIAVDATTSRYVTVRLKATVTEQFQVFFRTTSDPVYSVSKILRFQVHSSAEYVNYVIDTAANPLWAGTVTGLRVDFGSLTGATVDLDRLSVSSLVEIETEPYLIGTWDFSAADDLAGWHADPASGATPIPEGMLLAADASLTSPEELRIDAEATRYVTVEVENHSAESTLVMQFTGEAGQTGASEVTIPAGAGTYRFDMRRNGWAGVIDALALSADADVTVRSITIRSKYRPGFQQPYTAVEWDFSETLAGWVSGGTATVTADTEGLVVTSTGNDPYIVSPRQLGLDSRESSKITIRLRSDRVGSGSVFFTTSSGPTYFTAERRVDFNVTVANEWVDIDVEMLRSDLWTETITSLRIDPLSSPGEVIIQSVLVRTSAPPPGETVCESFDRTDLTWSWNAETITDREWVIVTKPAGGHNGLIVSTVGARDVTIDQFSNGGWSVVPGSSGGTPIDGVDGSDIQGLKVCGTI